MEKNRKQKNRKKKIWIVCTCEQSDQNDGVAEERSRNQNVILLLEGFQRFRVQHQTGDCDDLEMKDETEEKMNENKYA